MFYRSQLKIYYKIVITREGSSLTPLKNPTFKCAANIGADILFQMCHNSGLICSNKNTFCALLDKGGQNLAVNGCGLAKSGNGLRCDIVSQNLRLQFGTV